MGFPVRQAPVHRVVARARRVLLPGVDSRGQYELVAGSQDIADALRVVELATVAFEASAILQLPTVSISLAETHAGQGAANDFADAGLQGHLAETKPLLSRHVARE